MHCFTILCGGSGSRLWPKSREKLPKQFLKLTNDFTMLQNTILRISNVIANSKIDSKIVIICNLEHSHLVERQMLVLNLCIPFQVVCESKGRDSAPAICISALLGKKNDYTFILPCDHILDDTEFLNCIEQSFQHLDNSIVTFGIKPTRVETGYGYINLDKNNNTIQFVEKPNYDTAKTYLDKGSYLWNAGMFAFKNENMLICFKKYATDIYENCIETMKNTDFTTNAIVTLSKNPFTECRAISVDYAIMEKLCNDFDSKIQKKTILYNSTWNDIGSYTALYDELNNDNQNNKDKNNNNHNDNNVIQGDVIALDTKNCYVDSDHCLTATIGISDLIIVNTDDALLICDKEKTQDVKKIVEQLKQTKREEAILHKTAFRPWGYYKNVEGNDTSGFKMKKICVYPGKRLSLQSHKHRSEHWVITRGEAKVLVGNTTMLLKKDDYVYIPVNALHRIENIGNDLLEFTETQIGNYLGEDDIVRYEDDFGRVQFSKIFTAGV